MTNIRIFCIVYFCLRQWMPRGRVVSASDTQSRGSGFKFRSDHHLDLFYGGPEVKIENWFASRQPVWILDNVMSYLFSCLLGLCAINTAEGKQMYLFYFNCYFIYGQT